MTKLRAEISMSLDGFTAGPNPSEDEPLGLGGMALHDWAFKLEAWKKPHGQEGGEVNESTPVVEASIANVGATIMGRHMFGGGDGPWGEDPWNGWWGDDPPFHHPVFVLTHHERDPLELEGGNTFTFVTEGIESALEQAKAAADGQDIKVAGGASAIQQYLAAGLVDEFLLNVAPILLGSGSRLFEGLEDAGLELEPLESVATPDVTHLRFAVRVSDAN